MLRGTSDHTPLPHLYSKHKYYTERDLNPQPSCAIRHISTLKLQKHDKTMYSDCKTIPLFCNRLHRKQIGVVEYENIFHVQDRHVHQISLIVYTYDNPKAG